MFILSGAIALLPYQWPLYYSRYAECIGRNDKLQVRKESLLVSYRVIVVRLHTAIQQYSGRRLECARTWKPNKIGAFFNPSAATSLF